MYLLLVFWPYRKLWPSTQTQSSGSLSLINMEKVICCLKMQRNALPTRVTWTTAPSSERSSTPTQTRSSTAHTLVRQQPDRVADCCTIKLSLMGLFAFLSNRYIGVLQSRCVQHILMDPPTRTTQPLCFSFSTLHPHTCYVCKPSLFIIMVTKNSIKC